MRKKRQKYKCGSNKSKIGHVFVKALERKNSLDRLQMFAAKPDSRAGIPPLKRLLRTQMCFQVTDHGTKQFLEFKLSLHLGSEGRHLTDGFQSRIIVD